METGDVMYVSTSLCKGKDKALRGEHVIDFPGGIHLGFMRIIRLILPGTREKG